MSQKLISIAPRNNQNQKCPVVGVQRTQTLAVRTLTYTHINMAVFRAYVQIIPGCTPVGLLSRHSLSAVHTNIDSHFDILNV